jgi:mono/diheme cytochrome c family protein
MNKHTTNIFFTRRGGIITGMVFMICLLNPLFLFKGYAEALPEAAAETEIFWLWQFLGRLHPLAVHFPVSLLLFAAALEVFTFRNYQSKLRPGINLLVYVGSSTAIIAAVLGWLLSTQEEYGGDTMAIHQWSGYATAFLGAITLGFLLLIERNKQFVFVRAYRSILLFTAFSVSVAGHFGASLTHGNEYLSSVLPWNNEYGQALSKSKFNFASLKNDTINLSEAQELDLNGQVRAIFAHNCYSCHSAEKIKGELRLDKKRMVFKGGKSGPVIIPGDPGKSELMRRITLPRNHKEAMPSKEKQLSEHEIAIIKFWIEKGAPWPDVADGQSVFRVAKLEPRMPALPSATSNLNNPVDVWVNDYFKKKNITWPATVDDRTYLRRIYLDIIGLVPTPQEQEAFSKDTRPDKRALWVRQLLNREDDYAMHWLTFWNDALRNDYTGTGYITGGRFDITSWLYTAIKTNKPYNQFVKELINPEKESKGFVAGIKWRGTINASQRTEMQAAQNVAQVFLGLNLKCASCHDSFISDWKLTDAYAFANIFADTTLEINRCDKPTGKFAGTRILWQELGTVDSTAVTAVKLQQLAENLTKPANGRLYRTIVNRIWAQLMGRGIVEPVDAMDNEPWNQDLLDWMASDFVRGNYNIKEIIYRIATSKTYQLPSVGIKDANKIIAQDFEFKGMLRRRMSAEQFTDAISSIIEPVFPDSALHFDPYNPDKSKMAKESNKVVKLVKDTELAKPAETVRPNMPFIRAALVKNNSFLTALGRPNRETVSTGRDSRANLLQALELTNGDRLNEVLKRGAANWQMNYRQSDVIIKEIYRKALNREPQPKEMKIANEVLGEKPSAEGIQDLFWAIVLLPEFQIIY